MSTVQETISDGAVARSSLACLAVQPLNMVARFLVTPVVIASLGLGLWGWWSLTFALLSWIGLQRTGFVSASVPLASRALAQGDLDGAGAVIRASSTIMGVFGLVVLALVAWLAGDFNSALGVEAGSLNEANRTLFLMVAATTCGLILGGQRSFLEASNRYGDIKRAEFVASMTESALIFVLCISGGGLIGLGVAFSCRIFLQAGLEYAARRRFQPDIDLMPGRTPWKSITDCARFGARIQFLGMVHLSVGAVERLLLVKILGLETGGIVELARRLVDAAGSLVTQGFAPLVPATARFRRDNGPAAREFLLRCSRFALFSSFLPLVFLAAGAEGVLIAWLASPPPGVAIMLVILAAASMIHLATGVWTAGLRGLEETRQETLYLILWFLLMVPGLFIGAAEFGTFGAILAIAGAKSIASLGLLVMASTKLAIARRRLLAPVAGAVLTALVCCALVGVIAQDNTGFLSRGDGLLQALARGLPACALYTTLAFFLILSADDRETVLKLLLRGTKRFRPRMAAEIAALPSAPDQDLLGESQ